MVVIATYDNGEKKELTDYIITDGKNLQGGKTTVTITYTEDGITKTVTQNISVATSNIEPVNNTDTNLTDRVRLDNYLAKVSKYINPPTREVKAIPQKLTYEHNDDETWYLQLVPDEAEEDDIIQEDDNKSTSVKIVLISIVSVAVLATGIILIKRFKIKK